MDPTAAGGISAREDDDDPATIERPLPDDGDASTLQRDVPALTAKPNKPPVRSVAPIAPGRLASEPPSRMARRCATCGQVFSGEARFCPFDGDPLEEAPDHAPTADPLIGQTVDGRYEVTSVIGEGGMGAVYEVRHVALGRRFALKVLRRDIADAELVARFVQEAKAAAAIGHENIVAVTDFGELDLSVYGERGRVPYFVMEYLSGRSLASLLRQEGRLSPRRVAAVVVQCAHGLAAAHKAGVIHRDLKPDNIYLTSDTSTKREVVKLLDFGVAKMAGAGKLTRAGMVFGTPHYMSPEQAQGNPIDHRADIYAMGVILFECLTGRVPFEDDTYMGVLTKHMFETPPRIETVVPDVELGALGPIVVRCLSKNAHDRYADMIELADALDAYLKDPKSAAADAVGVQRGSMRLRDNEPFEQGRVSLPVEGPPMASRAPVFVALGVGLLVGLGVLAFSHFRSAQSAAPESSSATVTTASPTAAAIASAQPTASATPSASTPPTPTSSLSATVSASAAPPPTSTGPRHAPTVKRPPASRPPQSGGDIVNPWGTR